MVHGAPPCRTFSRARKVDKFCETRVFRTSEQPQGTGDVPEVVQANEVATKFARLRRAQHRAGGWFSLENPESSYMWELPSVASLVRIPGVTLQSGDQCMLGGMYRKPTSWLTNAPWMKVVAERCPGPPDHPVHESLTGFVYDTDGKRHWATELAAAYPESLCNILAIEFFKAVKAMPKRGRHLHHEFTSSGRFSQINEETKRQIRERENADCLGGLRNPHRARVKVPGWVDVGKRLNRIVDVAIDKHETELVSWLGTWGHEDAGPVPDDILTELRCELCREFEVTTPPPRLGCLGSCSEPCSTLLVILRWRCRVG